MARLMRACAIDWRALQEMMLRYAMLRAAGFTPLAVHYITLYYEFTPYCLLCCCYVIFAKALMRYIIVTSCRAATLVRKHAL